jgi:hypothetical protein
MLGMAAMLIGGTVMADERSIPLYELKDAITVTQRLAEPWASPAFALTPGRYYRMDLTTRSRAGAQVASRYIGADGKPLVVDDYNLVRSSTDWTPSHWYFQLPPGAVTGEVSVAAKPKEGEDDAGFEIQRIRVTGVGEAEVRIWVEAQLGSLPPLTFTPAADRWNAMPRTHARLQSGEPLRVVLLGDSIINDTFNGMLELMFKRQWPKANLSLIPSLRGGTGVAYYQQENRVKDHVLDHEPDLVIIGGICHGYDLPAMRSVVQQIRAASDTEILILTGAMAPEDFMRKRMVPTMGISRFEAAALVRAFYTGLPSVARESGAGYFDMRSVWDRTIFESGLSSMCYMRDELHGDMIGKLLLSGILTRYLGSGDAVGN